MDIIAAFRWDSSEKSISYMIVDQEFNIRTTPVIRKLNGLNLDEFKNSAEQLINDFFDEITKLCEGKNNFHVLIEHKIVGSASPAGLYHTEMHKPSGKTEFVRDSFHACVEVINRKNNSIKLAKQLRSDLKNPLLKEFKECLRNYRVVEKQRGNGFLYHLWALALHITQSTYAKKIKDLREKLIRQEPRKLKEVQKHESK